jgi:hypothetical protein
VSCAGGMGPSERQWWDHFAGSTSAGAVEGALATVPVDGFREVAMAFREVRVFEVREVLRLWLAGEGLRSVTEWLPTPEPARSSHIDCYPGDRRSPGLRARLTPD